MMQWLAYESANGYRKVCDTYDEAKKQIKAWLSNPAIKTYYVRHIQGVRPKDPFWCLRTNEKPNKLYIKCRECLELEWTVVEIYYKSKPKQVCMRLDIKR